MRATTIVGSTTFRCGFTSGLSSALIALEMQIRSPSVPCGGGGVDKHREMQKISTALSEDPVQVPGRVGRRSPPGLDTPSPPSETDELEIESRETIVTGASSPAAIPRRPDGWRALHSGPNGQMSLPRPVRFDYKPRGPQANTHYTVQARKERQKADALAQRTSYATGGHLSGRRELTYGSGYSTSTARAHQTIVKGHTQDSMRVRAIVSC